MLRDLDMGAVAVLPVSVPKRFEVLRRLGEGGMGVVYEARDHERGARIALKTLRSFSADALMRFKTEFRALQDLHHPNLVTLGELISHGQDEWFFTMELIEGGDFLEYIRQKQWFQGGDYFEGFATASIPLTPASTPPRESAPRPPNPEDAPLVYDEQRLRAGLRQLADGLHALHSAGLVHRDVKPSNIRVAEGERVVLLDFGLVAEVGTDSRTTTQHVMGTPAYMAPEQTTGALVGPETDWYGVGVLMYEALTGELPFSGSPLEVLAQKQRAEPKSPSAIVPGVPHDLDDICAALLRADPRERPKGSELLRAFGASVASKARSHLSRTQDALFVGRAEELRALRAAFVGVRHRAAATVLVRGESGVGKTCLVRHFVETIRAEDPEAVVLTGRCYERESVPYKAFDGVVDTLARVLIRMPSAEAGALLPLKVAPLAHVFPVLQRVPVIAPLARDKPKSMDPIELRSRAFAGMRELLTRFADRRPLIVIIDDAQWADDDSRLLLSEVLRTPDAPVLLLIATMRDVPGDPIAMRRSDKFASGLPGDVRTVELKRLSAAEGQELASLLLERSDRATGLDPEAIAREADGHPLFIDALVRHDAIAPHSGGHAVKLEEALWTRIEMLDELARAMMVLLAVAAAPVDQAVLGRAASADGVELAKRIALLRVAHLVQTAGARGGVDVYHDRIRMAVLAHLDSDERTRAHERLAVALEMSGPQENAEALTRHWRGAGKPVLAARYAAMAADHAASILAFDRAVHLYGLALSLDKTSSAEERRALHAKLGEALANAGRGALAASALQVAADGASPAEALDLRRRAAEQLLRAGHFDEGYAAISHVLAAVGMRLPATYLIAFVLLVVRRLYLRWRGMDFQPRDASQFSEKDLERIDVCWSVSIGLSLIDNIRGASFQGRHLILALRAGEPLRVARAFALDLPYLARGGQPALARTEVAIERTKKLAEEAGQPEAIGFAMGCAGSAYFLFSKFRKGYLLLDGALQIMREECAGMAWEARTMQWQLLNCLVQLGELKEVCKRRPVYIRDAQDRNDLYSLVNLYIGQPNVASLVDDDVRRAREEIDDAMRKWSKQGFHIEHYRALLARSNSSLYAGEARETLDLVTKEWPKLRRAFLLAVEAVRVPARWTRGRAAIAVAEITRGTEQAKHLALADSMVRALEREPCDSAHAYAKLLRAGIAFVRTDAATAKHALEDAATRFELIEMSLHLRVARSNIGLIVGGDEGRALVAATEAWFAEQEVKRPEAFAAMIAPGFARIRRG